MNASHSLSAAFGFVVAGILALTTSQASPPPASLNPASIRIEYMPHPRDVVQIKEGVPYTVPAARIFVLTALGSQSPVGEASISIDGLEELKSRCEISPAGEWQSVKQTPTGLTAHAGSVIAVTGGNSQPDDCRAWGYLANE